MGKGGRILVNTREEVDEFKENFKRSINGTIHRRLIESE